MANVKNNAATQETKRRLIEAAGEVFALRGYEGATIKEITERAQAAMAAVNYHFSDKRELYNQVISDVRDSMAATFESLVAEAAGKTPERRLRDFIEVALRNMLENSRSRWRGELLAQEMQQPGPESIEFMETLMRPRFERLRALISELSPGPIAREKVHALAESVIAHCLFYAKCQQMRSLIDPDIPPATERLAEITEHIVWLILLATNAPVTNENASRLAGTPASR